VPHEIWSAMKYANPIRQGRIIQTGSLQRRLLSKLVSTTP